MRMKNMRESKLHYYFMKTICLGKTILQQSVSATQYCSISSYDLPLNRIVLEKSRIKE